MVCGLGPYCNLFRINPRHMVWLGIEPGPTAPLANYNQSLSDVHISG